MTIFALQEDFAEELRKLFSEFRINSNQQLKKVNVFVQDIPFSHKKAEKGIFPYIIVRTEEGSISNEKNSCQMVLIFGVYNEDVNRQGYKDLLNMMQEVLYYYTTEKMIAHRYTMEDNMEWIIQDGEEIFPHFIGGISFSVELPKIMKVDKKYIGGESYEK